MLSSLLFCTLLYCCFDCYELIRYVYRCNCFLSANISIGWFWLVLSLVQGYSVTLREALCTKEDSLCSWLNYTSAVFNITLRSSSPLQWRRTGERCEVCMCAGRCTVSAH